MAKTNQRLWLLVTIAFAIGITSIAIPGILTMPGRLVPGTGGDAGKNIFAYLYHILYDKGAWFTGMNYPYGEHIIYTDAQPLLSVSLGYIKGITISQALTVMWWSILLSYVLAIVYVYKILLHYSVTPFIAMLFSGLIIMMSPQLFRTLGHFGLSYICIVPMLFYWTIKYHAAPQWKYAVYILSLSTICTFLHPYFSAVTLIWVVFYSAGYFILTKATIPAKLKHITPLLLSILLLFAITGIVVKSTDPIHDRPATPYGLTAYCTTGAHIFTAHYSPIWRYLEDHTATVKNTSQSEGFDYLGITAIVVFLFSIIKGIISKRKKAPATAESEQQDFRVWLFIAVAALLFSMGIPFVWNMEWIVNYLSFLKQFRTLGRFSWIFYYIVTIYAAVIIYRYYALYLVKGKKTTAYTLLVAAIALWSFEASGYILSEREIIYSARDNYKHLSGEDGYNWQQFLAQHHYTAENFQATLLLRFYNVGSDKLWLGRGETEQQIQGGLETGIQLHLPVIDAMMARSSWSIAEKQVKIAGGPYVHKPMLNELPNAKPFLLLNLNYDALDPDQKYLLSSSDYIGDFNSYHVYACYPSRIKANDQKNADSVQTIAANLKTGDTCIGSKGTWYINHFDNSKAQDIFWGSGAMPQIKIHDTVILQIPVEPKSTEQSYEFSCWFLLGNENYRSPYFTLYFLDKSGNQIGSQDVLTKESTDNMGLWFRSALFFSLPANCSTIKCKLCNDPDNAYKVMDELLLRPADALIISKSADGKIMANNHLLTHN